MDLADLLDFAVLADLVDCRGFPSFILMNKALSQLNIALIRIAKTATRCHSS
jgi:hypothetical protein